MNSYNSNIKSNSGNYSSIILIIVGAFLLLGGVGGCMWGWPTYNVYRQKMEGEAILAHAQSSREVAVAEAKAKMESASLLAEAEIARAKGVAQANQIIGESLKGNESYLRYLWIQGLESNNPTVIYVPTEVNLPILEAGRIGTQ
jgi:regulator of protease activity HflC (stomatin/prohibitin superfamily)